MEFDNHLAGGGEFPLAGVMIREGLATDARFVALATTITDQYHAAWFVRDGTATEEQPLGSAYAYPDAWVALVRAGDTLALYTSADGATWTWERSVAITGLAETVNVGVFVTSGATAVEATATVTDFSIVPLPKP